MKKIAIPAAIVILLIFGWTQRAKILQWSGAIPKLQTALQNNTTLENIRNDILAPPPLRSLTGSRGGVLTNAGVIEQTNIQRQENGNLAALSENAKLDQSAQLKLQDMFKNQYFEHVSPAGKGPGDLAKEAGYNYVVIGENLALGNFKDDADLVNAWMNSPGHRANILNVKYVEIGVAVGKGNYQGQSVWLAVQEFGRPASACPSVNTSLKTEIDSLNGDIAQIQPQLNQLKNYLDTTQPKTRQEVDQYNQAVAQYNSLVEIYNNKVDSLKTATADYNAEVKAFNACVGN